MQLTNFDNLGLGGDKEVPNIIKNAKMAGLEVIEVVWHRPNQYGVKNGVWDLVVIQDFSASSPMDEAMATYNITPGKIKFYPDERDFCWGYIVGTEHNLWKLARSFSNGRYRITDKTQRDMIQKIAEEENWSLTPAEKPKVNIKKTTREIKAEQATNVAEKKIKDQEKYIQELKNAVIELQKDSNVKLEKDPVKPLAGKKISKEKREQIKSEYTEE